MDLAVKKKNLEVVKNLAPRPVLESFAQLCAIPRPSGHEDQVRNYLKGLAAERGFRCFEDKVGNLLIKVPGVGCSAETKPVIIQGHLDIVAEKSSESKHDFFTNGIELGIQDGWLKSTLETTLGADNGVGVAAALALLQETTTTTQAKRCPPLELLFTVDEERGLKGALGLDAHALEIEARTLLNLDTEEAGSVYIGCSGGGDSRFRVPAARQSNNNNNNIQQNTRCFQLAVSHCTGGHSGVDIDKNRCNAIELLATLTTTLFSEGLITGLVSIQGGDKRNAIPRDATAVLGVGLNQDQSALRQRIKDLSAEASSHYSNTDPNLKVSFVPATDDLAATPLQPDSATGILSLLVQSGLKRGPLKMSESIPDLVETSSNLASIHLRKENEDEFFEICCSTRSSVASQIEDVRADLARAVTSVQGTVIDQPPAYTGWQPNLDSRVLNLVKQCYQAQTGNQPEIKAIHAGLECGMLISKIAPDLDCVSFGPTIVDAHTPDERLELDTVEPFFTLLQDVLDALCDNNEMKK